LFSFFFCSLMGGTLKNYDISLSIGFFFFSSSFVNKTRKHEAK